MSRDDVSSSNDHVKKIFIGAVREGIDEEDLKGYFGNYGRITDCIVMRDLNGAHRGFAFVEFTDPRAVDTIVAESQPHVLRGQTLDVKKAVPKPGRGPGGPPRGRGSFGAFRGRGSSGGFRGRGSSPYSSRGRDATSTGDYYGGRDDSSDSYSRKYGGGGGYYGECFEGGRGGSRGQYSRYGGGYYRGDASGGNRSSGLGPMRSNQGYADGQSFYPDNYSSYEGAGDKSYNAMGNGYDYGQRHSDDQFGSPMRPNYSNEYRQQYGSSGSSSYLPSRGSFKQSYSDYSGGNDYSRYQGGAPKSHQSSKGLSGSMGSNESSRFNPVNDRYSGYQSHSTGYRSGMLSSQQSYETGNQSSGSSSKHNSGMQGV